MILSSFLNKKEKCNNSNKLKDYWIFSLHLLLGNAAGNDSVRRIIANRLTAWWNQEVKDTVAVKNVTYMTWIQNKAESSLHSRYAEARKSAALRVEKIKMQYGHQLDSNYWQANKVSCKSKGVATAKSLALLDPSETINGVVAQQWGRHPWEMERIFQRRFGLSHFHTTEHTGGEKACDRVSRKKNLGSVAGVLCWRQWGGHPWKMEKVFQRGFELSHFHTTEHTAGEKVYDLASRENLRGALLEYCVDGRRLLAAGRVRSRPLTVSVRFG